MKLGWVMVVYGVTQDIIIRGIDHIKKAYSLNKTNFKVKFYFIIIYKI